MSRLPRIKPDQALIELLQDTTIHGLNHVYSAKLKFIKFIWLLLFIMGIVGFSINLLWILKKFLSNPILVNTFADTEKFVWPDLTFCNPTAPFDLETNEMAIDYWKKIVFQSSNMVNVLINQSQMIEYLSGYKENLYDFIEKAVALSTADYSRLRVDNFQRHVKFQGFYEDHDKIHMLETKDLKKCNSQELFSTKFVQYGNNIPCHTFQIENSPSLNLSLINSLVFFINLNYESHKVFNSSYQSRSFLLYITSKFRLPEEEEIVLSPGYHNEITITQNRMSRSSVKNPCRDITYKIDLYDTLYQFTFQFEGGYDDCRKFLSQKIYVENCQCYNPFLPVYKNNSGAPRLCFNITMFSPADVLKNSDCIARVYQQFSTNSKYKEMSHEQCDKYKPVKCDEIVYKKYYLKKIRYELNINELSDNMKKMIKSEYEKMFRKQFSYDSYKLIKENLGLLQIKRKSKFGDLIKEESEYSFSSLISDIGGLMGIWLGLSVIGLCEIVGFCYFLSMRFIDMGIKRKNHHQGSPIPVEQAEMIST